MTGNDNKPAGQALAELTTAQHVATGMLLVLAAEVRAAAAPAHALAGFAQATGDCLVSLASGAERNGQTTAALIEAVGDLSRRVEALGGKVDALAEAMRCEVQE